MGGTMSGDDAAPEPVWSLNHGLPEGLRSFFLITLTQSPPPWELVETSDGTWTVTDSNGKVVKITPKTDELWRYLMVADGVWRELMSGQDLSES
jgi:membrane carboxypeptidase/penicillin-binding protein PbpC